MVQDPKTKVERFHVKRVGGFYSPTCVSLGGNMGTPASWARHLKVPFRVGLRGHPKDLTWGGGAFLQTPHMQQIHV